MASSCCFYITHRATHKEQTRFFSKCHSDSCQETAQKPDGLTLAMSVKSFQAHL